MAHGDMASKAISTAEAVALMALNRARGVPEGPPPSAARKVFVVGCPRSGTSWVRDLFEHHPMTITGHETHLYPDVHAPLVHHGVRSAAGWGKVLYLDRRHRERRSGAHLWRWLDRGDVVALVRRAMSRRADEPSSEAVAQSLVDEIYDRIAERREAGPDHVLVDKTPGHVFEGQRILSHYADARMVEVVRDPRDVCVSMQLIDRGWFPRDRRGQIELWARSIEHGLRLRQHREFADRVTRVRFEDLKADTEAEVARLLSFVGLDGDPSAVSEIAAGADFSRHDRTGDGEFRRKGEVGDWVNHLGSGDLEIIEGRAEPLMAELGYALT